MQISYVSKYKWIGNRRANANPAVDEAGPRARPRQSALLARLNVVDELASVVA
jgi:hypothetical protein